MMILFPYIVQHGQRASSSKILLRPVWGTSVRRHAATSTHAPHFSALDELPFRLARPSSVPLSMTSSIYRYHTTTVLLHEEHY